MIAEVIPDVILASFYLTASNKLSVELMGCLKRMGWQSQLEFGNAHEDFLKIY
jgi:hypothetical protein